MKGNGNKETYKSHRKERSLNNENNGVWGTEEQRGCSEQ